jgi:hypothetical protein
MSKETLPLQLTIRGELHPDEVRQLFGRALDILGLKKQKWRRLRATLSDKKLSECVRYGGKAEHRGAYTRPGAKLAERTASDGIPRDGYHNTMIWTVQMGDRTVLTAEPVLPVRDLSITLHVTPDEFDTLRLELGGGGTGMDALFNVMTATPEHPDVAHRWLHEALERTIAEPRVHAQLVELESQGTYCEKKREGA